MSPPRYTNYPISQPVYTGYAQPEPTAEEEQPKEEKPEFLGTLEGAFTKKSDALKNRIEDAHKLALQILHDIKSGIKEQILMRPYEPALVIPLIGMPSDVISLVFYTIDKCEWDVQWDGGETITILIPKIDVIHDSGNARRVSKVQSL